MSRTDAVTKRALVTGAAGALGGALAEACAAAGYELLLLARRRESIAANLESNHEVIEADLCDDASLLAACERLQQVGDLGLLVHAAGSYDHGRLEDTTVEKLDRLVAVNVRAPFMLTKAVLPALRSQRGGIVFVNSSVTSAARIENVVPYAMTKAALRALADGVRDEENRHGVSVLSVYPGRTAGPLQEALHELEGRPYDAAKLLQPEDVARAVLEAVALPATAEITDLRIRPRLGPQQR